MRLLSAAVALALFPILTGSRMLGVLVVDGIELWEGLRGVEPA